MRLGIVGAGWAGLSAAIHAQLAGHDVTLFEAAADAGGRARRLTLLLPNGTTCEADNGQHILIGAYRDTLALLQRIAPSPSVPARVGANSALLRLPLSLCYPDGTGLRLPFAIPPFDALTGIATATGWSWSDKWSLLRAVLGWQVNGFQCAPEITVATLCRKMRPAVLRTLIEPLCVSALNTPMEEASASVFLRVLRDSLMGGRGASNLLLPRCDLSQLLAEPAVEWLRSRNVAMHWGCRIQHLRQQVSGWQLLPQDNSILSTSRQDWPPQSHVFDRIIWATSAAVAARTMANASTSATPTDAQAMNTWAARADALQFEAITTVYLFAPGARLAQPLLALPAATGTPAQFVFDRGQLGGPTGLLAFVVSASRDERSTLLAQVLQQAQTQLTGHLGPAAQGTFSHVQTVVEKRATFACTPALVRPPVRITTGLLACGDYTEGPYPATLEGAVRSGIEAVQALD